LLELIFCQALNMEKKISLFKETHIQFTSAIELL